MNDLLQYKNVTDSLLVFNSTVKDGNMSYNFGEKDRVLQNRYRFFNSVGIDMKSTCAFNISNSDDIFTFRTTDVPKGDDVSKVKIKTDGIITDAKNAFFYLAFGDCIPFLLFDTKQKILGFAHLSWLSTCKKLHTKIFDKMVEDYHTKIDDLICLIGPSIKANSYCFENPAQLEIPEWQKYVYKKNNNLYSVDLLQFIINDVLDKQIKEDRFYCSDIDTGSDNKYYSHYRSANKKDCEEGRFIFGVGII